MHVSTDHQRIKIKGRYLGGLESVNVELSDEQLASEIV